jgi:hypothetical protein
LHFFELENMISTHVVDFCGINGPNLLDFENFKETARNLQHLASSQNTK